MENTFFIPHQSWEKYHFSFSLLSILTQNYSEYTVKVLHIVHASSLGCAKSYGNNVFFFFFFFLKSSFTLKSGRIPL